eukprot:EG_transcript_12981
MDASLKRAAPSEAAAEPAKRPRQDPSDEVYPRPSAAEHAASSSNDAEFSVLTWNVLAHSFTIHNKQLHRTFWNMGREDPEQTQDRYRHATEALLSQRPDVVLLQECEPAFLKVEMELNLRAHYLLDEYVAYCCFGADGGAVEARQKPGCAILLHKAGKLQRVPDVPIAFSDGDPSYGGQHLASLAVLCRTRLGQQVWVACLHQRYEAPIHLPPARGGPCQRGAQLHAIRRAMQNHSPCRSVVLGGDFNASCRPQDTEFVQMRDIESCTWLGQSMARVLLTRPRQPGDAPTGLSPDWSTPVAIDHVYASHDLRPLRWGTGGVPQPPYRVREQERMRSSVEGASDHVWIRVWLRHCGPPAPKEPQTASVASRAPPESGILSFGTGGPPHGIPWDGYKPVEAPPEPSMRGRRIRMLVPKFGMGKGQTAVIMGPSKSNKCWE